MPSPVVTAGLGVILVWILLKLSRRGSREAGLPPGPPTLPLLGNLHQFPKGGVHTKFAEWSQQWGNVFSLKLGSGTIVVLSSAKAVRDIVDRSGWSASDRPPNFLVKQATDDHHMGFMRYGPRLRSLKKSLTTALSPQAAINHLPIQQAESAQLLYDFLKEPQEFYYAIRRHTHSVAKSVIYGKRVPQTKSPEAKAFFDALHALEHTLTPGNHPPIDLFPFLKYLPDRWAPWMQECRDVSAQRNALHYGLLKECEARVARGDDANSFIEEILRKKNEHDLDRDAIAHLGIVLLEGGTDTTSGFLQSMVLMMTAFPEIQLRAQKEIDGLVGESRLPNIDDIDQLPYVAALIKEMARYRPMLPLGLPHAMSQDEHFEGYLIPKDAMLFVNIWGLSMDPEVYDHPEVFNPERYVLREYGTKPGIDEKDFRDTFFFGSGRRICPGMHIAKHTMALTTMRLLWAFNFTPAIDPATSKPIPADINNYSTDITLAPRPYKCTIKPRSAQHAQIIESAFADSTDVFVKYEDSITEEDRLFLKQQRAGL